jgi:hypothetical protein
MRKVHPDQPQLSKPAIDKKIQRKPSITGGRKKPLPKQVDPEISISKVTLESKRGGRRIKGEGQQCNECGFSDEFLWKYTKSNFGVVYLCWRCKPKVFDRSFGKIDATRMTYPGHFESNPHRH